MPGDKSVIYASTHEGDPNCPAEPERRADGKYVWPIYSDFDIYTADLEGNILKKLTDEPGAEGLVMPTKMELYWCNVDGSNLTKITDLGNANWAPFFHPSGEKVIFASNHKSKRGFPFNLFMINLDGTGLEQITFDDTFDSFPMFSYDGKKLVFASNRNNGDTRDTNLFLADWVD